MIAEKNGLQQIFEFNKSITEQEIRKEFEDMKGEEVEFHSLMSDYVLKTILLIGSKEAKKCIYDVFSYVLKSDFTGYDLSFNEIPKISYGSIANKMDLHFVNEDHTSHVLVEINPRDLETVKNRNLSYLLKMGGEFYSYLKGNLEERYKIPINVKLLNINDYIDENYQDTLTLNYQDSISSSNLLNKSVDIYNLYLPNYEKMVYTEDNEDVKKTIAMMHARSYKEMEELAENSLERMSLYSIFKKLGRDVKFMVFRLEGEELEAFNASVRSELEDKAREKGRKEGFEEGKEEGIEQGRNEGIEQGIEQGVLQNREDNARKMIEKEYPLEDIEEITGISKTQLEEWMIAEKNIPIYPSNQA